MGVFDLEAILSLNSKAFDAGLNAAKTSASSIGGAIGKGLMSIGKMAVGAVGVATTAVTGFAASAVKTGMDFDKSMSQVYATMGEKANEMIEYNGEVVKSSEALRDFAQEMGRTTSFSATEAADALNYMALAGYDAETSMSMLPNVLNLAAAGNFDLARASDMVTDTQTAFGISLERTTQMVDEMARASSTGNTSVEQLGEAFLTVGGLAQELNGGFITLADGTTKEVDGIQELEIALTAMANAGIKSSEAGTHMRNMLLKLSSPTDAGTQALEAMGVAVFDSEGKMRSLADVFGDLSNELDNMTQEQKIQIISDLFNTRDLASAEALLKAVNEDWDEIGESILGASEAGVLYEGKLYGMEEAQAKFGEDIYDTSKGFEVLGAAEVMALTQLDNLDGSIKLFKSALEGAKIAISDELTPSLKEFVDFGASGLSRITDAFKSDGLDGAMTAFGEVLSEGLKKVTEMLPGVVDAGIQLLEAFGKGIVDNAPVLFDSLFEIGGMIGEKVLEVMESIASSLEEFDFAQATTDLINYFAESFEGGDLGRLLEVGLRIITAIGDGIFTSLPILASKATEMMQSMAEGIANFDFVELANSIVDFLMNALTGQSTTGLLNAGINILMNLTRGIFSALPTLIAGAARILQTLVHGISQKLPTLIPAAVKMVGELAKGITDPGPITQIVQAAGELLMSLVQGLLNAIPELLQAIPVIIANLVAALVAAIPQIISVGIQLIFGLITGIVGAIPDLVAIIPSLLLALVSGILQGIGTIVETGKALIDGFLKGISDAWNGMVTSIVNFFTGLITRIKELFGIHSPSTVFSGIGKDIVQGLIDGIRSLIESVKSTAQDIFNAIKNTFDDLPGKMLEIGKNVVDGLKNGIAGAWDALAGWFGEKIDALFDISKKKTESQSPSKKYARLGKWIDQGLALGLKNNMGLVETSMNDVLDVLDTNQITSTELPYATANITNIDESNLLENTLVDAFVRALDKYGLTVEVDHRALGRVVRKEVYA